MSLPEPKPVEQKPSPAFWAGLGNVASSLRAAPAKLTSLELSKRIVLSRALKKYDRLKAAIAALEDKDEAGHKIILDADAYAALKQNLRPIVDFVLAQAKLERVSPVDNERFLSQLVTLEKVHPADLETLRQARIGMQGGNKECRALVVPTLGGRRILSAIYVFHTKLEKPLSETGYGDLPGNVDEIKDSPVQALTGEENYEGYYTISSGLESSGAALIKAFINSAKPDKIYSTISPVRGFTSKHDRDDFLQTAPQDVRQSVLDYLFDGTDPVMAFHLKNGAYIGEININPESKKDWITINYIYDTSRLLKNADIYEEGEGLSPLSPPLYQMLNRDQLPRAYNIGGADHVPVAVPPAPVVA